MDRRVRDCAFAEQPAADAYQAAQEPTGGQTQARDSSASRAFRAGGEENAVRDDPAGFVELLPHCLAALGEAKVPSPLGLGSVGGDGEVDYVRFEPGTVISARTGSPSGIALGKDLPVFI